MTRDEKNGMGTETKQICNKTKWIARNDDGLWGERLYLNCVYLRQSNKIKKGGREKEKRQKRAGEWNGMKGSCGVGDSWGKIQALHWLAK